MLLATSTVLSTNSAQLATVAGKMGNRMHRMPLSLFVVLFLISLFVLYSYIFWLTILYRFFSFFCSPLSCRVFFFSSPWSFLSLFSFPISLSRSLFFFFLNLFNFLNRDRTKKNKTKRKKAKKKKETKKKFTKRKQNRRSLD